MEQYDKSFIEELKNKSFNFFIKQFKLKILREY